MILSRVEPNEYREYGELYNEYEEYLCCEVEPSEDNCFDWGTFYVYWNDVKHKHYFVRHEGKVCGFICICTGKLPYGADYYIVDTYIRPEYQGQGMGLWMVHTIQNLYHGTAILQIKWGNTRAKRFWAKAFEGYECLRDRVSYLDNDWCLTTAYRKIFKN